MIWDDFGVFNYVNKKLKKVLWWLLKLGKYAYLCRMNYSIVNPRIYVLHTPMCEQCLKRTDVVTQTRVMAGALSMGAECYKNMGK